MNAITTYDKTRNLLRSEEASQRFAEVLGDKDRAQIFLASVLSVVTQSDKLMQCDPQSIMLAALKAATLQLVIEPAIGQAYIIPYKDRATFQIGYKGIIQLALRTKQYLIINATEVYEGEEIKQNRLSGVIVLNGKRISDKVIGYASYFEMKSGYKHYFYMTVEQLHDHAKKYSPSYKYGDTLWHTNFDVMAKKTVLKQNLSKYGQLSVNILADDEDVIDAEFVAPPPEVKVEQPVAPEPEKKPGKKKEEKVQLENPLPSNLEATSTSSDPSISYPNVPLPPPEQVGDAFPPREPEAPPDNNNTMSIPQMLAHDGYFRDQGLAKAAMMWYQGPMDYPSVCVWAAVVRDAMSQGKPLAEAAKSGPK